MAVGPPVLVDDSHSPRSQQDRTRREDRRLSSSTAYGTTSSYIPNGLGVLVIIAGLGYLIDSFGMILSNRYDANVAGVTFAARCC
jgi:hypothetical protein